MLRGRQLSRTLLVCFTVVLSGQAAAAPQSGYIETLWLLRRGLVIESEIAQRMAELVIEAAHGKEEVERQRPFSVSDQGDRWLIEGSFNKERRGGNRGPAKVVISKKDARVLDLSVPYIMKVPPEVREIIRKTREQRRGK